jgi:hypothetical protein
VTAEQPSVEATLRTRVFDRLSIAGSGQCWEWKGRLNGSGYGTVNNVYRHKPRNVLVHRFMYEMAVGPIPSELQIDHLCRNRACGNPKHMELVTSRENTLRGDGPTAKNTRKTHCPRGHEYTPENTYTPPGTNHRYCKTCKREVDWQRRGRRV